ncbi:MAG TPA: hypothetical protein VMT34_07910 [Aggregatilineales bacterium]|nr:hypothetical protein [Aggregatilineales bacterium]
MFFPTVTGSNLEDREFVLPYGLDGEYNVLMLAFEPTHQSALRSWLPTLDHLAEEYTDFRYYEVAVLWDLPPLQRLFVDNGMRRAIQDEDLRARVITVYVDKAAFCNTLDLTDEERIYVLLIDREGQVLWRTDGAATRQSTLALIDQVRLIFSVDNEINFPLTGF